MNSIPDLFLMLFPFALLCFFLNITGYFEIIHSGDSRLLSILVGYIAFWFLVFCIDKVGYSIEKRIIRLDSAIVCTPKSIFSSLDLSKSNKLDLSKWNLPIIHKSPILGKDYDGKDRFLFFFH